MKKLLVISSVWVEPNSSAAGSRMLQLLELFLTNNYQITYVSTAKESEFAFQLSDLGINTQMIPLNNASFDEFIVAFNPEIVLFDRFIIEEQFGWRVAENCPNALRILDTEDLHFLRETRRLALKNNQEFKEDDLLSSEMAKREIASIYRCDLSLIISNYEMKILKNTFNIDESIIHYIPFLLEKIDVKIKTPSFDEREHFYFVGNFLHQPNIDCVQYLKKEIWSNIRKKLPKAELHIYGAYMPEKIKQLHKKSNGFIIKGRTNNLTEIIQNTKICLAPLRFGAGLKGKFLEAMQNGTPSITTKIGAEAMYERLEWSGSVATTSETIINDAIDLYSNEKKWKQAQQNGFDIINTCYDKRKYSEDLFQKTKKLLRDLSMHRKQNFIGELLQHHTLKSTKYLSKWIEEKNEKLK